MNLEERESLINDYVDGLLDGPQREAFEAALATDRELQSEVAELRRLLNLASTLPASIAPPPGLWKDIESRITDSTRPNVVRFQRRHAVNWRRFSAFLAAAAITLVAGAGYWTVQRPQPAAVVVTEATAAPDTTTLSTAKSKADEAYALARAELLDALAKRRESFSPEIQAALRDNMAVIDAAIHEINLALADDPENPALLHMLVATRDKELNLIEELVSGPQGL